MLSTDSLRRLAQGLSLAAGCLLAGCTPRVSGRIAAVCQGVRVGERVSLVIDSVGPAAEVRLGALRGRAFDLALTLFRGRDAGACEDRTGHAHVSVGELPDALAHATAGNRGGQWWIQGTDLVINLNPRAADDNLIFTLPLDGGAGRWSLATLAGPIARGRLLPEPD